VACIRNIDSSNFFGTISVVRTFDASAVEA